jgi:hypothetical protein
MSKSTFKEVIQDGLPILADIVDIRVTWSSNDAAVFLQQGAVLLSVAKIEDCDDRGPFRFALGWPRRAGDRPELWRTYEGC